MVALRFVAHDRSMAIEEEWGDSEKLGEMKVNLGCMLQRRGECKHASSLLAEALASEEGDSQKDLTHQNRWTMLAQRLPCHTRLLPYKPNPPRRSSSSSSLYHVRLLIQYIDCCLQICVTGSSDTSIDTLYRYCGEEGGGGQG